ncbi:MAG: efflux RND transporter periplasmic adaptor subunit [Spirochaetaceae bacterium]|jgi:membrane fusion protein (multidrug efflux system)|nr:efflux RND transporter periplasmic adaptor subunit [Spirochaetaceae bacterium]
MNIQNRCLKRMSVFILSSLMLSMLISCSQKVQAEERHNDEIYNSLDSQEGVRRTPVTVNSVPRLDFTVYGEYYGEARGVSEVSLSAGIGGRVALISAEEGQLVTAGQSLAKIDPERAETLYQTAVLNERVSREALDREERFLREGSSFQVRVDQARLQWLQAKTNLLNSQLMRDGALAITPISGTVVARHVELYDELEPEDITFVIADLNQIRISVGVPEADMAGFQEEGIAEIRFSSYPDKVFPGQIVSYARTRSNMTLSYEVDIIVDNSDGLILSGQTARVKLALKSYPDVLVVPSPAVFTKQNQTYVMVIKDNEAREQAVEIGTGDNRLTIIYSGLTEGDLIVTEGFNRLSEGTPVQIVQTLSSISKES